MGLSWQINKFILQHPFWTLFIIALIILALIGLVINLLKGLKPASLGLVGGKSVRVKNIWSTVGAILMALGMLAALVSAILTWLGLTRLHATAKEVDDLGQKIVSLLRDKHGKVPMIVQEINDRLAHEHLRQLKAGSEQAINSLNDAYQQAQNSFERLEQPLTNMKRILDDTSVLSRSLQEWLEEWRAEGEGEGRQVGWKKFRKCQEQAKQAHKWLSDGYQAFKEVVREARDSLPKLNGGKQEKLHEKLLSQLVKQVVKDAHYLQPPADLDERLVHVQAQVEQTSGVLRGAIQMRRWLLLIVIALSLIIGIIAIFLDRARIPRMAALCLVALIPLLFVGFWLWLAQKDEADLVGRLRRRESFPLTDEIDSSILWQTELKLGALPKAEIEGKLKAFSRQLKRDADTLPTSMTRALEALQKDAHGCDAQAQRRFQHPPTGWQSFLQQSKPQLADEWDYLLLNYPVLYREDRMCQRYPVHWETATAMRENLAWMEKGVESCRKMAMRTMGEACGAEERALAQIATRGIGDGTINSDVVIADSQIILNPLLEADRIIETLGQICKLMDPLYEHLEGSRMPILGCLLAISLMLVAILVMIKVPILIWDGFKCVIATLLPCIGINAILSSLYK